MQRRGRAALRQRILTSFGLSDGQVDRLRDAGRQRLRNSPEFQPLRQEFN
jgi:hypothetical protein